MEEEKWKGLIEKEKKEKRGRLDLSDCRLYHIPDELSELPWITELYLDQNFISKIEKLEILPNILLLSLWGNNIKTIEGISTFPNLFALNLNGNEISKIEGLENNTSLKELYLACKRT